MCTHTHTETCSHVPVDFRDLQTASSLLCFSLSYVAKIEELYPRAQELSAFLGLDVMFIQNLLLLFSFCLKRKIYLLLKPSSEDFSKLRRPGGKWKIIKLLQDLGDDLFSLFVTSKAVQFAGLLSQKKTICQCKSSTVPPTERKDKISSNLSRSVFCQVLYFWPT